MYYSSLTLGFLGSGLVPLLLAGCSDEVAGRTDTETSSSSSGSAGPTDPISGDGSSGETTGGVSSSDDASSDASGLVDESTGTSGEPVGQGRGRFVVRAGLPDGEEGMVLVDYADGVVGPQIDLLADLPEGFSFVGGGAIDEGRLFTPCWQVAPSPLVTCGIIDLAADRPGPLQSLASGAVPQDVSLSAPRWSRPTQTLYFTPRHLDTDEDVGIFAARVTDGQVAPPQLVQAPVPDLVGLQRYEIGPNGENLGYALTAANGVATSYVTSADPLDEAPPVAISNTAPAGQRNGIPRLLPEHAAAFYPVHIDTHLAPTIASLWFVDLSGDVPTAPVRLDDPAAEPALILNGSVAPDQHALAYWVGPDDDIFAGELMWVALSAEGPPPPMRVSTLSEGAVFGRTPRWSPDSRWLSYQAVHEGEGRVDLYLLEAGTQTPSDPVLASEGLVPGGSVTEWVFSDDGQYVYLTAPIDDDEPGLFRIDLSGDSLGPLEAIGERRGRVDGDIVLSHDGTELLYPSFNGARELALVDVSENRVGHSSLINGALSKGREVGFGPRFSADDSVVAYRETASLPGREGPSSLRLVNVATPGVAALVENLDAHWIATAPMPR